MEEVSVNVDKGEAIESSSASCSGGVNSEAISLRPKTMFSMKGKGKKDVEAAMWAQDGPTFALSPTSTSSPTSAPRSRDKLKDITQWQDAPTKKDKTIRYTREEILSAYKVPSSPPTLLNADAVFSVECLAPVLSTPTDLDEIYKQWTTNRDRGKGRGRVRGTGTPTSGGRGQSWEGGETPSGRGKPDGRWDKDKGSWEREERAGKGSDDMSARKWEKPGRKKSSDESQWQRGAKVVEKADDLWDDVPQENTTGITVDMDLSNMASATEEFRKIMDRMKAENEASQKKTTEGELNDETFGAHEDDDGSAVCELSSQLETAWGTSLPSSSPVQDGSCADLHNIQNDASSPYDRKSESSSPSTTSGILTSLDAWGSGTAPTLTNTRLTASAPAPSPDVWFYLDPSGNQQGPFKTTEMRDWFDAGYFKPQLPVRAGHNGSFLPLAVLFQDGKVPFSAAPTAELLQHQEILRDRQQRQQQMEQQRMEQLMEQQRMEHQLMEQQLMEQQRMEHQRMEQQRMEQQHIEQQRMEQQHIEQQRMEQQRMEQHRQIQLQHWGAMNQKPGPAGQRENLMRALGIHNDGGGGSMPGTSQQVQQQQMMSQHHEERKKEQHSREVVMMGHQGFSTEQQSERNAWGSPNVSVEPTQSMNRILDDERRRAAADIKRMAYQPQKKSGAKSLTELQRDEETAVEAAQRLAVTQAEEQAKASQQVSKAARVAAAAGVTNSKTSWDQSTTSLTTNGTKSLKAIQNEEQKALAQKRTDAAGQRQKTSGASLSSRSPREGGGNLANMGAQLKMMLGVPGNRCAGGTPWVAGDQIKTGQSQHSKSLRDILAEEEKAAQVNAIGYQGSVPCGSGWVGVVKGSQQKVSSKKYQTHPTLQSKGIAENPGQESIWQSGSNSQQQVSHQSQSKEQHKSSSTNEFGGQEASSGFMTWCEKHLKKIIGGNDMTLIHFCLSLNDPVEIRQYIAAYLGSTPEASAFATEFIRRKNENTKSSNGATTKALAGPTPTSQATKKGKKKKGKGLKVDPSLLGYSVSGSGPNQGEIDYGS